jgi:hypothetical protein
MKKILHPLICIFIILNANQLFSQTNPCNGSLYNLTWQTILNAQSPAVEQFYGGSSPAGSCDNANYFFNDSKHIKLSPDQSNVAILGTSSCKQFLAGLNSLNGQTNFQSFDANTNKQGIYVNFLNDSEIQTLGHIAFGNSNSIFTRYNNNGGVVSQQVSQQLSSNRNNWGKVQSFNNQTYVYGVSNNPSTGFNEHTTTCYNEQGAQIWTSKIAELDWWYGYPGRMTTDLQGNVIFSGKRQTSQGNQNTYDVVLRKVNPNGQQLWQIYYDNNNLADYLTSVVSDAEGNIYFSSTNTNAWATRSGRLVKVNGNTGAIIFQTQISTTGGGTVRINTDGNIIVGDIDNQIKCYNPLNGTLIWSQSIQSYRSFEVGANGNIFVVTNNLIRILNSAGSAVQDINTNISGYSTLNRMIEISQDGNAIYLTGERSTGNTNKLFVSKYQISGTPSSSSRNENICSGDSLIFGSQALFTTGVYTRTELNQFGCDSTITLNLTVNQPSASTINATITQGESYSFNGQNLYTAGTYTATLQNAAGCDSVVTLNLTVEPAVEPLNCEITANETSICLGQSTLFQIDSPTGQYTEVVTYPSGFVKLTEFNGKEYWLFNQKITWSTAKQLGDSLNLQMYVINNAEEENIVYNSLPYIGNDGIWYWLGLYQDFLSPQYSEPSGGWTWVDGTLASTGYTNWVQNQEPNNNQGSEQYGQFEFITDGKKWNDTGDLPTNGGNLSMPIYERSITNSSSILWSTGETTSSISVSPNETTTYSVTVTQGTQTCTSDVTIVVKQPSATTETASACESYTWNGNTYNQTGTYTWTGTNAADCDSVVTLNLTITPQPEQPQLACWQTATFNTASCSWVISGTQPAEPTGLACYESAVFNSNTCEWEIIGTQPANWYLGGSSVPLPPLPCYVSFLFNDVTCDWEVIGTPAPAIVTNASACVSYTWEANGATYNTSGLYSFNSNCQDYTLNLIINQPSASTINATITSGESYSFNSQNLTAAGTYTSTLQNSAGCDSVVTLNLVVEPAVEPLNCEITASDSEVCNGENLTLSMEVSGQISTQLLTSNDFNVVGTYNGKTYLVTNAAMTWNDAKVYSENLGYQGATLAVFETLEENNAVDALTNQYNEWLWFGLFQDLSSPQYSEPLGGWSWVNGAQLTYSNWENGEPNNLGGENFAHLKRYPNGKWNDHFAEVQSKAIIEINEIQSVSYLWSNGETTQSINVVPTETTTYSCVYTSGNQTCTSEVTITVNQPSAETVNATITEGESYNFNGQNLTAAGTYTATLQNAAGCDSVVTLNLTVNPAPVAGCYATSVVNFSQGLNAIGNAVSAIRSNDELALGMPEPVVTNVVNFVSLGFGGSITLAFEAPIANGDGHDIRIDEATWNNNPCNRYPERADVFASQDGVNFVYLGVACQDASFDLGALSWAQYVRIVDISDLLSFSHGADGFDVNGIECLNGAATSLNDDGLVACSLQEIVSYTPGNRKNGTAVGAPRNNPANALGTPQNNNTINFTALGFGGTMVAKFDYVVFNQPGNDLRVIETSFGNPSCNNYPEKARVSVSMDNLNWIELGEICQDGEIDLANVNYAQYIKIQDASPLSSNKFNGAADGYDVDAVVVLNNGCGTSSARLAQMDNTTTPDASLMISAFPNPMEDYTIVNFEGLENDSDFNFQIMDAAGRVIRSNNIRVTAS